MENKGNMPRHVAIIPDGNRRWAKKNALAAWMGHDRGTENLENIVEVFRETGVPYFSFWGSSQDNLAKRPKEEVNHLLEIFKREFTKLANDKKVHDNKMKVNIFGAWRQQFPPEVKAAMDNAIEKTKDYDKYFYNFFIAYSGTEELLDAVKEISAMARKDSNLSIDQNLFKKSLLTKDLPPVDLLIRTGGEPHNSDGFMMWDVADAQLFFSEKLWPDFTPDDLREALTDYSRRERRMGK